MKTIRPSGIMPYSYKWGRLLALAILAVTLPLLVQCRGIGGYKSISFSKAKLATPPTTLSQRDYPFDEKGRYRTDWVKSGSTKKRSMSSFRSAPTAPTPTPTQTVAAQSPKKSSNKKSSSSMSIAANTAPAPKSSPPPVYTPPPTPKPKPKPPTPAKKQARYHTIAKGDTLWGISRRYKVPVADIKSANGLSSDLIRPGQTLRLP